METFERSGRIFRVVQIGRGGPSVFWGTGAHEAPEALIERLEGQNLLLVAYQAEDWNRCFSPWPAPPAFGSEGFAGEGARTLRWLTDECAPQIASRFGAREKLLCGYSLAGLFAVYAWLRGMPVEGIGCFSGSLWYDRFADWAQSQSAAPVRLALSIGDREKRTGNPRMAQGEACTLLLAAHWAKQMPVRFWLEKGGHFDHTTARIARGIDGLLGAAE